MTLDRNITEQEDLERYLLQLAEMVGRRLRKNHYTGRTVALTIRYQDFTTFSRRRSIGELLYNSFDIYLVAREILLSLRITRPVRLSIRVTALSSTGVSLSR